MLSPLPASLPISIHAPREGSDPPVRASASAPAHFNPRSPARGATSPVLAMLRSTVFQSTLPARGATCWIPRTEFSSPLFQSTLPARGATQPCPPFLGGGLFQSTLPARGATSQNSRGPAPCRYFNPRSPRGERRQRFQLIRHWHDNFNPRSPRGERRAATLGLATSGGFQSTLPARGATIKRRSWSSRPAISIHAPREGSDRFARYSSAVSRDFNPRSPRGERLSHIINKSKNFYFNPRSPRGERL